MKNSDCCERRRPTVAWNQKCKNGVNHN